uniref:Gag protein, putative n=1 Tax=Brugia malayi TaxID=6279 RepID=A8PBI9_BRUMA
MIERIFRQLTNLGENLEQTSIELTIEEKLPLWVLDEVYKRKELDPDWSVGKFDNA